MTQQTLSSNGAVALHEPVAHCGETRSVASLMAFFALALPGPGHSGSWRPR